MRLRGFLQLSLKPLSCYRKQIGKSSDFFFETSGSDFSNRFDHLGKKSALHSDKSAMPILKAKSISDLHQGGGRQTRLKLREFNLPEPPCD